MINELLKNEQALAHNLPINPDSEDLYQALQDGLIGIYLVNIIDSERFDLRTVNYDANHYEIKENLFHFFTGCRGLINVIGLDAKSFL